MTFSYPHVPLGVTWTERNPPNGCFCYLWIPREINNIGTTWYVPILLVWCHPGIWETQKFDMSQKNDVNTMATVFLYRLQLMFWHGLDVVFLRLIGLPHLQDTWMSPQEQYGHMLCCCFLTLESRATESVVLVGTPVRETPEWWTLRWLIKGWNIIF